MLGEQSAEDHQLLRAGETPRRAKTQQKQCYEGELRQRIPARQIRAKQDLEFDQAHISWQNKDSRCPLLTMYASSSHPFMLPSLLCSLLCLLCDMIESLVLGVLSSLLKTRGSYKNKQARIRKQLPIAPQSDGPLLPPSHAHICPCFATCSSMCPLLC